MARRQRKPSGLRKLSLVPENALPLLLEAGFRAAEGAPETAHGFMDRDGRPRRIVARWANGWRADLRFHVDGSYSLTQCIAFRVKGPARV